ncbi:hypothetical protein [Haloferax sp. ATB1]|uniref:hypothetical protein n=1 Tax=Haloferax sp. ATB1 TaxID=1508454 RepID=UPI0005B1EC0F|nr:hypothetical protein [Haloferax sp. ATB1]
MTFENQTSRAFRRLGKTLGRQLTVTVTVPGEDDLGRPDGTQTVESETTYQGRLETSTQSNWMQDNGGGDVEMDVEIWLPDDVDVIPRDSTGSKNMTITDERTGKTFVPLDYHDESNSWVRIEAVEGANAE